MGHQQPREETGRVIALAAALWGTVIGIAAAQGALARFEGESVATLAALVSLFAVASLFLDPQLRAYGTRMEAWRSLGWAFGLAGAFVMALALASVPLAMFLAPLASFAGVAALARPRALARSAPPAKSPGANPAAT